MFYIYNMAKRIPLLLLILLSVLFTSAQPFPIGFRSDTLIDASRGNRQVTFEISYPAVSSGQDEDLAVGSFPVTFFAHGDQTPVGVYENFSDELCPDGHIMVYPTTEIGPLPPGDPAELAQDLIFLREQFELLTNDNTSYLFQKLNGRAAYSGHGWGGGVAVFAASQDTSITALYNFGFLESNTSALASGNQVIAPAMIFSGSEDCIAPDTANQIALFDTLNSSCKFLISIDSGLYCKFANVSVTCDGLESACAPTQGISYAEQRTIVFRNLRPWLSFVLLGECDDWSEFQTAINSDTAIQFLANCDYTPLNPRARFQPDTIACDGDTLFYVYQNPSDSFFWSPGGFPNQRILPVTQTGTYQLFAVDEFGCLSTDDKQRFTFYPLPSPSLVLSGDTFICPGDLLKAQPDAMFDSYLWSNGDMTFSTSTSDSGYLFVTVTDTNGCVGNSDSAFLKWADQEAPVSITANDDTLTSSQGNTYQWFTDTGAIDGATQQTLIAPGPGDYWVLVFKENLCEEYSDTVTIQPDNILSIEDLGVKIYPNPVEDQLSFSSPAQGTLTLYNSIGEMVLSIEIEQGENIINTESLQSGVFILSFKPLRADALYQQKIIKH